VRYATYAIETFDPDIFRLINKDLDNDPERFEKMIDYFNDNQIGAEINVIVGFKKGDDLASLEAIRKSVLRFNTVDINIMYLIPLFDDIKKISYRYSKDEIDHFIEKTIELVREKNNPNMQISIFYSYDQNEFYCDYNYVIYIHKDTVLKYNLL
jgi:hypothetical protein